VLDAPRFGGIGSIPAQPEWLGRLWDFIGRRGLLLALIASLLLLIAATVPTFALPSGSSVSVAPLRSSIGTTADPSAMIGDLSVATFAGDLPFVRQSRYMSALTTGGPEGQRFVQGAREASIARYIQDVGVQVTLPYVQNAIRTQDQIIAWDAAVTELDRQAAIRSARASQLWQPAAIAAGVSMPSTVTFYACVGNGFCGNMASGIAPFEGAAACSSNIPFGTKFYIANDPSQRTFVCLDRGALAPNWVDVWFYDAADGWAWQSLVGTSSEIVIVE
jgi:hypothetical protein